jgi:hypothetical protein
MILKLLCFWLVFYSLLILELVSCNSWICKWSATSIHRIAKFTCFVGCDKPVFVPLNFSGREEIGKTGFQFVNLHISFLFISCKYNSVLSNRIRNTSISFRMVLKLSCGSRNSPVSIATLLRSEWPGNRGLFPARHEEFFSSAVFGRLQIPPISCPMAR